MSLTDYGSARWAGIMFGIGSLPANFYIALCTGEPGDGWDGSVLATVEPTDAAYARQPLAVPTGWALTDGGLVINAVEVVYPEPVLDWGLIPYFALLDAATAGNVWSFNELLDPVFVPAGLAPSFDPGSFFHAVEDQLPTIAE